MLIRVDATNPDLIKYFCLNWFLVQNAGCSLQVRQTGFHVIEIRDLPSLLHVFLIWSAKL